MSLEDNVLNDKNLSPKNKCHRIVFIKESNLVRLRGRGGGNVVTIGWGNGETGS